MPKARLDHNAELPKRWQLAHGAYYYRVPAKQRELWQGRARVRLGKTLAEATAFFEANQAAIERGLQCPPREGYRFRAALWRHIGYQEECGISLGMMQHLYTSSRLGAESRSLSFSLHPRHLIELAKEANGRCMLTGIEWNLERHRSRRPWAPSLDRIDCAKGYEPGNVRLVCVAVNLALSDFGEAVLLKIAQGLMAQVSFLTQPPDATPRENP